MEERSHPDSSTVPVPAGGCLSVPGGRDHNEDSCLLRDYSRRRAPRYLCLMAVADGMGGHRAGEKASSAAVLHLEQMVASSRFPGAADYRENAAAVLGKAVSSINGIIYREGRSSPGLSGMGTTLTCAMADGSGAWVAHVGDSRAYLVSSSGARQVTEDHSLVGKMLKEGVLTEEEARVHGKRNVLTRAVGPGPEVEVDLFRVPLLPGEVLLLCSDGLHSMVTRDEIWRMVHPEVMMQQACEKLVRLATDRGADDNITVVSWRVPRQEKPVGNKDRRRSRKRMKQDRRPA